MDSKTQLEKELHVDFKMLNQYLDTDKAYFGRYVFTTAPKPDMDLDSVMLIADAKAQFTQTRLDNPAGNPLAAVNEERRKPVLAENVVKPELTQTFDSITECARVLQGDRHTIRDHLNGKITSGPYRKT